MTESSFITSGKNAIRIEQAALGELIDRIDSSFVAACELLMNCKGRAIVTGIGKSGHIGSKIASTLASTGTPAFFLHPAEASHGDLGMITQNDVVIAISYSGSSSEIVTILPTIGRLGAKLISLTGKSDSSLAKHAQVNIDISVAEEACPLNLAPTSSTTAALAMGDALAIALLEAKGFSKEDFALSHPGGNLGKQLLLRVKDVMIAGAEIPKVKSATSLADALQEISSKHLGMTTIIDEDEKLIGVFTDGDLRRCLEQGTDINSVSINSVMCSSPRTIKLGALAAQALNTMENHKITSLIVEDDHGNIAGVLHMHDLLRAGLA